MSKSHNQKHIDEAVMYQCTQNCMGHEGNSAGCCTLGDRDYIMGPIPDSAALLARLNVDREEKLKRKDVFVEYKEGRKLFPHLSHWQNKKNFPALRVRTDDERLPCIFLGEDNLCTIHEVRSKTCRKYHCAHLNDVIAELERMKEAAE